MKVLFSGSIQVYFVSLNVCFLSNGFLLGVIMSSFAISMLWSYNVKRVAFGKFADRLFYSTGATLGAVFGLLTSDFILKLI